MSSTIKQYLRIGDNLKRIRENLGESQTKFAERIEISRSTYSNYENNNRVPDDKTLQRIAEALNTSINDLIGVSEQTVIVQSETIISNRLVMESTYQLLGEVLRQHDELSKMSLTANEIINADNCYWELLVPDVINTIKNSVTRFAWRENHGKLKPRDEEVKINLGLVETEFKSGLVLSGSSKLIPLSKIDEDKDYLKFKLEEIKKKLDILNSDGTSLPENLTEK